MSYNGWTNYATWNVELWIDNDYGIYMTKMEMLRRRKRPVTGETVKLFFQEHMNGTTPDLDEMRRRREPRGRINFREIAGHWESERQELNR